MNASMILGIIAGVLGLIVGFGVYALGSAGNALASAAGTSDSFVIYQILAVAAPVGCLAGAGWVKSNPIMGAGLMGASALGMFLGFGIGMFTIFPIALAAVASVLGFMEAQKTPKQL